MKTYLGILILIWSAHASAAQAADMKKEYDVIEDYLAKYVAPAAPAPASRAPQEPQGPQVATVTAPAALPVVPLVPPIPRPRTKLCREDSCKPKAAPKPTPQYVRCGDGKHWNASNSTADYKTVKNMFKDLLGINIEAQSIEELKPGNGAEGLDYNRAQYWVINRGGSSQFHLKGPIKPFYLGGGMADAALDAYFCELPDGSIEGHACQMGQCMTTVLQKSGAKKLQLSFQGHADWNRQYRVIPANVDIHAQSSQ